uniref:Headcase N-terminal domain-containing protein n=1 Tax=Plectus sambesii TaxID=2011161 RepID=A0A914W705_9BILA
MDRRVERRSRNVPSSTTGRGKLSTRSDGANRRPGCHVPLASGCLKGYPVPKLLAEGVKMVCTNKDCPYTKQLVHQECYAALEDFLVKRLANIGSARGWTDSQRRSNLWDKKGFMLIKKLCRCLCDLGQISRDIDSNFAPPAALPIAAKKKRKSLPKLNFNGSHGANLPRTTKKALNALASGLMHSSGLTDDEEFDFYALDNERYGWLCDTDELTIASIHDDDGVQDDVDDDVDEDDDDDDEDNDEEEDYDDSEWDFCDMEDGETLHATKLKIFGVIQRSFEAFGYIEADELDTNAFFVPSHVDWDSVFRCLGNVPTCRKFPSLKVFRAGTQVVFDCMPQTEKSGCRWMATRVWMVADEQRRSISPRLPSIDDVPFPSFLPFLPPPKPDQPVPEFLHTYDMWRGSSFFLGEMTLSRLFRANY